MRSSLAIPALAGRTAQHMAAVLAEVLEPVSEGRGTAACWRRFADLRGARSWSRGGSGFIGAHAVYLLVRALGCRVTALDDLSNSTPAAVAHLPSSRSSSAMSVSLVDPLLRTHPWVIRLACRTS